MGLWGQPGIWKRRQILVCLLRSQSKGDIQAGRCCLCQDRDHYPWALSPKAHPPLLHLPGSFWSILKKAHFPPPHGQNHCLNWNLKLNFKYSTKVPDISFQVRLLCKSLQGILPPSQASGSLIDPPEQRPAYIWCSRKKKSLIPQTFIRHLCAKRQRGRAEDHLSAVREPEDNGTASLALMIIMPSANKTVQNKTPLFWQMRTHVWVWVFMASNIILKSPCKGYFFLFLCSTINKGAIWMFHHVSFLPGWVIFAPKAPGPFLAAGSCKTYLWVGRV